MKLVDVIIALETISANLDFQVYFNKKSKEFIDVSLEWLATEEYETLIEEIEYNGNNYISLPEKYEINEYSMMEDFIWNLTDKQKANQLIEAIQGKGAFSRFRQQIINLGVADAWYEYRDHAYKMIAKKWCQENNIKYEE